MKEKEMTPQESMEIITEMIQETHRRTPTLRLRTSVMWATLTIVTTAAFWASMRTTGDLRSLFVWLAIPAVGLPLNYLMVRRGRADETARSRTEAVIGQMWCVIAGLGAALAAVCLAIHLLTTPGVWLAMLLYAFIAVGAGAMMQGLLAGERSFVWGGWTSMLTGFALCGASFSHALPKGDVVLSLFALCFALMFILPVCVVRRKRKSQPLS